MELRGVWWRKITASWLREMMKTQDFESNLCIQTRIMLGIWRWMDVSWWICFQGELSNPYTTKHAKSVVWCVCSVAATSTPCMSIIPHGIRHLDPRRIYRILPPALIVISSQHAPNARPYTLRQVSSRFVERPYQLPAVNATAKWVRTYAFNLDIMEALPDYQTAGHCLIDWKISFLQSQSYSYRISLTDNLVRCRVQTTGG